MVSLDTSPLHVTASQTTGRLNEVQNPSISYQGEVKTVPGSVTSTNRNSIAAHLNDNNNLVSTGMKGSAAKMKDMRLLRNSE